MWDWLKPEPEKLLLLAYHIIQHTDFNKKETQVLVICPTRELCMQITKDLVSKEKDRYYALKRILDYYPDIFGLIFCRTRRETGSISEKLEKEGYNVVALHGDLSQVQRDAAMKKFRARTIKVLVATDVAARGIDVYDISHVIHYNLPDELEY